jgi:hypothetical protein
MVVSFFGQNSLGEFLRFRDLDWLGSFMLSKKASYPEEG